MAATTTTEVIKSAKKNHQCSWCGHAILKGNSYNRYRYFDGGDAGTVKMHPECLEACDTMIAVTKNYDVEFIPGDYPRGCWCEFNPDCKTCLEIKATINNP